ncbi:S66 peptidase family protein [Arthrobacter sp. MYb213]|uniref:S66 family peptidase n=1 Tax=Arthrobacter sp. MYb213 TaxID=1848595 RepID=UPI000CFD19AD|nr:S66 peptidase family protein [Arthrobacter sp. MYb213]PRB69311.1 LD-carboxypeptidase [Arthrobacter sp. MYb213]
MEIRYPQPLKPGDLIAVTAPSSGVNESLQQRLNFAVQNLRNYGFKVQIGSCMDGTRHTSAPAEERAAELMRMLLDPAVKAVVPPWGGDTAIDLMSLLDFETLRKVEPTWFVGYSDISTLLVPLTLLSGMATLHGGNLMDTPYEVPDGLMSWIEVASLPVGTKFRQFSPGIFRLNDWDDWENNPQATKHLWNGRGGWERFDMAVGPVDVRGRLIGGCIETLVNLAGTAFLDSSRMLNSVEESSIVYVEASGVEATTICRQLHGMRLAGFFNDAQAILVGRTGAPNSSSLTQREAVLDALGMLGIPIIGNVECGHVPPQLPIVNGAKGHLVFAETEQYLEQELT